MTLMASATLMLEVRRLCRLNLVPRFGLSPVRSTIPHQRGSELCYKLLQTGYKTQDNTLLLSISNFPYNAWTNFTSTRPSQR